jgi:hypothetical protein
MTTETIEAIKRQKHMGKRIKDFSPDELRQYNTAMRRASRARRKEEKEKEAIIDADDYRVPQTHVEKITKHLAFALVQIKTELAVSELSSADEYIVDGVCSCGFALTNGWTKIVRIGDGVGILAGEYFPDAMAHEMIEHIRSHHSVLINSPTFQNFYGSFLAQVVKLFSESKNEKYQTPEFIEEAKRELVRLSE